MSPDTLPPLPLPPGIRSRFIDGINGLRMHLLEAGFEAPGRPLVLLLHGFPELAYSWRKVIPSLAAAGYHVVAPDQRGYGRTTGWDGRYDGDLASFRMLNLVKDALALVFALGHRSVHALVGHDFGSFVAAWSSLIRPDIYRSVTLMSAPFAGPPPLPMPKPAGDIHQDLAALERPRKHYQWYYSTRQAEPDMLHPPQGLHAFFRAYYHHKSADWKQNRPFPLQAWTATELEKMPTYYIMDLAEGMAETVAHVMPTPAEVAANKWLTEPEMAVYAQEFARTGFQGSLNWYRCMTSPAFISELQVFAGRTIDVPSCFIAGRSDWGIYQRPGGDILKMQKDVLTNMRGGLHLLDGAGHWVQQEQPEAVNGLLLSFLQSTARA
ncbi:MAG TPA: alpha/beta hydrolase [Burkholderiales bacterium]|jgi:pimeloyl-ACP methyl ester carboxylesterase|nr:alpha/beta hydrolase [Burkholderiales bacterium]